MKWSLETDEVCIKWWQSMFFCIIYLLSEYLEHWIASIRTYAMSEKCGYPKIILIGTHKDEVVVYLGFMMFGLNTVDSFIFVCTNFYGLNKNRAFVAFKIGGYRICPYTSNLYRKLVFRGYWNSWMGPSTKTTNFGTRRKLNHPQYM